MTSLPIPLDNVRSIAVRYGFSEIQFNEQSRVIAFQSLDSLVRINVYYTTGTIATCLSHPTKGKTQLFRRNQTVDSLEAIFGNPRTHTGEGYYHVDTLHGNRLWSPIKRKHGEDPKTECDDSQRWRYVQMATGFCKPQQASQIAAICELWNELRFDRNGPSTMDVYNSFPEEVKSQISSPCPSNCGNCGFDRAGSTCVLGSILIEVARVTEGPEVYLDTFIPSMEVISDSSIPQEGKKILPCTGFTECQCHEGLEFQQSLSSSLQRFRRQLMSFPKPIRRELIYFFLKKLLHGYDLLVGTKDPSHAGFLVKTDEETGEDIYLNNYGGRFLSNDVLSAHSDYGDLTYGKDEVVGGRCTCHGIRVAS